MCVRARVCALLLTCARAPAADIDDLVGIVILQQLLGGGDSFSAGGPGKGMYTRLYKVRGGEGGTRARAHTHAHTHTHTYVHRT